MIRLVHMLRRAPGLTQEQFAAAWRDRNGPLAASVQTDLDIVRYLQVHPDPAAQGIDSQAAEARGGMQLPYDGIAEYWWRSEDALRMALSSSAGRPPVYGTRTVFTYYPGTATLPRSISG